MKMPDKCAVVFVLAVVQMAADAAVVGQATIPGTAATWNALGEREVELAEQTFQPLMQRAKNVILFLGDGMGISTVTAARIMKGGEGSLLAFEHFPNTALSKTYCADTQVTDSAASSTAYQCGVKTNKGLLGLDPRVSRLDCQASLRPDMQLTSILDWSLAAGKSVGLVTNTRITHATPGGAYANVAERDWEGDSEMPESARQAGCRDIARQLVEDYPNVQVLMGGAWEYFLPGNGRITNSGASGSKGKRLDNRDLTQEWLRNQTSKGRNAAYVWTSQDLRQLDLSNTDYLLGLFASSHLDYELDRNDAQQPSLAEMTSTAVTILSRNPNGFYLLVEGGRIDHSHHENNAYNALHDTIAFSDAVETAGNMTSVQDTLTITTADHSHTMVIAGYQHTGNSILDVADVRLDERNNSYTTLLYGTGPGYRGVAPRTNVTNQQSNKPDYKQESVVGMPSASHGGEDVAIYAKGPMSHLVHSVKEENFIAHLMAYASCVGHFRDSNRCPPLSSQGGSSGAASSVVVKMGALVISVLMGLLAV